MAATLVAAETVIWPVVALAPVMPGAMRVIAETSTLLFPAAAAGVMAPSLASLLVALWWRPLTSPVPGPTAPGERPLAIWGSIDAVLLALLAVAAAIAPRWAATDPAHPGFADALTASGLPLRLAVLLGASSIASLLLLRRSAGRRWLWVPNLAGFLALLTVVVAPLAPLLDRERQLPLRQLQTLAGAQSRPAEPLWVIGYKRYSTVFYAGRSAVFIDDAAEARERLRREPQRLALQPGTTTVLLLGDREHLEAFGLPPSAVQSLGQRGEQRLWRVALKGLAG